MPNNLSLQENPATSSNNQQSMGDQLLAQLHEQYAINHNASLGSLISFFVAIIVVLGFWGMIFIKSNNLFSDGSFIYYDKSSDLYTLDALLFASISVNIVLTIIVRICLNQGFAQRYDQFIIHAIRCKYLFRKKIVRSPIECENDTKQGNEGDLIFPKGYHPFNKDKDSINNNGDVVSKKTLCSFLRKFNICKDLNIVQGIYGDFVCIAFGIYLVTFGCLLIKIIPNFINPTLSLSCPISRVIWIGAYLLVLVVCILKCYCLFKKKKDRYMSYKKEFEETR